MEKLKSSLNSIISPTCLQESSTQSFRENKSLLLSNITSQTHNSQRFFFSPCQTRDIMEEFKSKLSVTPFTTKLPFLEETVKMTMDSYDPFQDFGESMKEMVEAHRIRDWPELQELLHCYLRVNEKKNHKIIELAFVDLLMHIMTKDNEAGLCASFPLSFLP